MSRRKIPRETRFCECNCGGTFECKVNSKQRFLHGHSKRGKHYSGEVRKARPPEIPLDPNNPSIRYIPLTQNQYAICDAEDYNQLVKHNWFTIRSSDDLLYPATTIEGRNVMMHNFLMNPPPGSIVDHHNRNPLDNRKSNLRITDQQHNSFNMRPIKGKSSVYKGVRIENGAVRASITRDGITHNLGIFDAEEDAAKVYDEKARELFGEFAYINFN